MSQALAGEHPVLGFARRHTVLSAAVLAGCMMVCFYGLLGIWPFGDATVLTGDLNMQYVPYYAHFQRFFGGEAGFAYGFDKSLGGGLLGLFAYYVASPLNLLYLLVPVRSFPLVANLLLGAKVVLAAATMQLYLAKKFPALGLLGLVPALGYAFSAYVFVYAQNIMWHDVLILLPLVCLGVDRILFGKSPLFYAAVLALAILANFYIAYMACLFLVLYFVFSLLCQPAKERRPGRSVLCFAGGSLLGGGLSAVLLLPTLYSLSGSKGDLFSFQFSFETQFPLWQLPEKLAFNSFLWPDVVDGEPLLYCGLLLCLLALCFFVSRRVPLRPKLAAGALLLLLVVSFWVKGFDTFWHGLKEPVWFPYRYAWLFCFTVALLAASALAAGAVRKQEVLFSGGVLALVFLLLGPFSQRVGFAKLLASAAGILVFALLLWLYARSEKRRTQKALAALLLLAVCGELCLNAVLITRKFENYPLAGYRQYVDGVGAAMRAATAEAPGARVEKNFYRTLNDPMLLGYRGMSHFGSTQDNAATDTLWNLGYRGNGSYLYGSTAFADGLLGVQYLLDDGSRPVPAHWQNGRRTEAGTLYENPYAMPLLFTVAAGEGTGLDGAGLQNDSFAWQNALFAALGGEGRLFSPAADAALLAPGGGELPLAGTVPPGAEYRLRAEEAGYHYALAVAQNPLYDLDVLIDGAPAGKTFTADQNGVINLGYLEKGQQVSLGWETEEEIELTEVYFARLDEEALSAFAREARENGGDFSVRDGAVEGHILAEGDRTLLFTSIPYDGDWTALVNGREVEASALGGGFLTLPLEEGENEISLRYRPAGVFAGAALSAASLLCFLLLAFLAARRKRGEREPAAKPSMTEETGR